MNEGITNLCHRKISYHSKHFTVTYVSTLFFKYNLEIYNLTKVAIKRLPEVTINLLVISIVYFM
jgi:hypothetical protein